MSSWLRNGCPCYFETETPSLPLHLVKSHVETNMPAACKQWDFIKSGSQCQEICIFPGSGGLLGREFC